MIILCDTSWHSKITLKFIVLILCQFFPENCLKGKFEIKPLFPAVLSTYLFSKVRLTYLCFTNEYLKGIAEVTILKNN